MFKHISFDDCLLAKLPEHFDDYPGDYVRLITTALAVISYPFLDDSATSSQSRQDQQKPITSKKVM
jgi:hypothetical protein